MLKKEWRDILLPVLLRLMVGPVLAVTHAIFAVKINETSALLFFIGYAVSVFWVALHLGLNAFHSEFRDRAFEYLLTFPFRRSRLLGVKFAARLLILGFLLSLYCLLQSLLKISPLVRSSSLHSSPFFNAFNFSFLVISLFIVGFFLSLIDWKSARPAVPLLILVSYSALGLLIERPLSRLESSVGSIEMSGILLMFGSGVFFVLSFRRMERGTLGNGWRKSSQKSLQLVVCQKNGGNWGLLRHEWPIAARSLMVNILLMLIQGFLLSMILVNNSEQKALSDRTTLYAIIAGGMLLMVPFGSGNRLLYNEFRFKALEYILTFPLSLRRILLEKLLARIVVLGPAALIFMIYVGHFSERISQHSGMFYVVLRPAFFPFWMALLLLNGFFLSLFEMKNIMALVSLANLFALVLIPLALFRLLKHFAIALSPQTMALLAIGSGLALTTTILAGVFFKLLPRFDLAAPNRYSGVCGLFLFTTFTILSLVGLAVILIL